MTMDFDIFAAYTRRTASHVVPAAARVVPRLAFLVFLAILASSACSSEPVVTAVGEGGVRGWVCMGPHGTPSAAAQVVVQDSAGTSVTATTDDAGYFSVDHVSAGAATLVASNGITQVAESFVLESDGLVAYGADCATANAGLTVHVCVPGSLDPSMGATVELEYLDLGGPRVGLLSAAANAQGDAIFSDLMPGDYRVRIIGRAVTENIALEPLASGAYRDAGCFDPGTVGSISGRVCNPLDGNAVSGVPVELQVEGDPLRETETDDNGAFRFDAVPPGEHTLTIRPPLQVPTDVQVQVDAGDTTVLPSACTTPEGGRVSGVACDPSGGGPLATVSVRLEIDGDLPRYSTATAGGYFKFNDVPEGQHNVVVPVPGGASYTIPVVVVAEGELWVESSHCVASMFGAVEGRICDPSTQNPVEDILVDLEVVGEDVPRSTLSDANGDYAFDLVPAGAHKVVIRPPLQNPVRLNADVSVGPPTVIPSPTCGGGGTVANPATLEGIACVGVSSFHAMAGATVEVVPASGTGTRVTVSGLDGAFTVNELPAGTVDVTIRRGSWFSEFSLTLSDDQTLDIGMTHCVGAGTRVAVVTGSYDFSAQIFSDLGLPVRKNASGTIVNAGGVVDIIDGVSPSVDWVEQFAASLATLNTYDMIILTSGLNLNPLIDTNTCGLPPSNTASCAGMAGTKALSNLSAYLEAGGAVYVSDWAYDVVRRQFPGYINFYDNDYLQSKALCGGAPSTANGTVLDENLAAVLGTASAQIVYQDEYAYWSVIDSLSAQRNSYLVPFVVADVPVFQFALATDDYCDETLPATLASSPLLVATPVGTDGGRLVFCTFRYVPGGRNKDIIQQIILEL